MSLTACTFVYTVRDADGSICGIYRTLRKAQNRAKELNEECMTISYKVDFWELDQDE